MLKESCTILMHADQRGVTQSLLYRSWHSFHYGTYHHPYREAPGALRVFNEDTLAGGASMQHFAEHSSTVLLFPLVGGVAFIHNHQTHYLDAGSILSVQVNAGMTYEIGNPYVEELVSYLHIVVSVAFVESMTKPQIRSFNLDAHPDTLQALCSVKGAKGQFLGKIGKFSGRTDASYLPQNPINTCFVFVIEGVFEVQNRLLHSKDGILLPEAGEVEFEALSNDGIFLIFEL